MLVGSEIKTSYGFVSLLYRSILWIRSWFTARISNQEGATFIFRLTLYRYLLLLLLILGLKDELG